MILSFRNKPTVVQPSDILIYFLCKAPSTILRAVPIDLALIPFPDQPRPMLRILRKVWSAKEEYLERILNGELISSPGRLYTELAPRRLPVLATSRDANGVEKIYIDCPLQACIPQFKINPVRGPEFTRFAIQQTFQTILNRTTTKVPLPLDTELIATWVALPPRSLK